ncbi:MAG: RNA polymerase sigma factor [Pirellula sp.]|jgi:RNA polymerase sigma-70 factor (ECF subfamily)
MPSSVESEHNSEEEKSLIYAIVHGHAPQYAVLVERFQPRIFASIFAMVGNRQDAEDLTQEAFLTAYRKLGHFENRSSFYTWLHRIAFHLAIDLQRRKSRTTKKHLSDDISESSLQIASDDLTPESVAMNKEMATKVKAALQRLDAERKNLIVLRDIDGLDYAQIAEVLDIPIGTVRSRLHRARMELRDILQAAGVTHSQGDTE